MKNRFFNYLDQFINYLINIKNYSNLTAKTYKTPISKMIEISEIYDEDKLTIFDITKYRIQIASQNSKTINKKLSSIRSFIQFLESKNIKSKIIGDTSIKSNQTLPKPINTNNIFESLENNEIDEESKLIILLIYSFGIRISELSTLKLENIDKNYIKVLGKGNKQRQIPSNDTIKEAIAHYLKFYKPDIYLFEKKNKALTKRQLQYKLEMAFQKIGIKATPHQIRHSFATDLLNEGARINDISQLLGHSSLKATGIYTKLNTNTKLKQYNKAHPLNQL
ncbi:MAG: tyrosine-type recombinase/integrase [Campylobacterota bacterium]|nr:tyrosine-type recombinase/integrase [Campylobacterota bacterium]